MGFGIQTLLKSYTTKNGRKSHKVSRNSVNAKGLRRRSDESRNSTALLDLIPNLKYHDDNTINVIQMLSEENRHLKNLLEADQKSDKERNDQNNQKDEIESILGELHKSQTKCQQLERKIVLITADNDRAISDLTGQKNTFKIQLEELQCRYKAIQEENERLKSDSTSRSEGLTVSLKKIFPNLNIWQNESTNGDIEETQSVMTDYDEDVPVHIGNAVYNMDREEITSLLEECTKEITFLKENLNSVQVNDNKDIDTKLISRLNFEKSQVLRELEEVKRINSNLQQSLQAIDSQPKLIEQIADSASENKPIHQLQEDISDKDKVIERMSEQLLTIDNDKAEIEMKYFKLVETIKNNKVSTLTEITNQYDSNVLSTVDTTAIDTTAIDTTAIDRTDETLKEKLRAQNEQLTTLEKENEQLKERVKKLSSIDIYSSQSIAKELIQCYPPGNLYLYCPDPQTPPDLMRANLEIRIKDAALSRLSIERDKLRASIVSLTSQPVEMLDTNMMVESSILKKNIKELDATIFNLKTTIENLQREKSTLERTSAEKVLQIAEMKKQVENIVDSMERLGKKHQKEKDLLTNLVSESMNQVESVQADNTLTKNTYREHLRYLHARYTSLHPEKFAIFMESVNDNIKENKDDHPEWNSNNFIELNENATISQQAELKATKRIPSVDDTQSIGSNNSSHFQRQRQSQSQGQGQGQSQSQSHASKSELNSSTSTKIGCIEAYRLCGHV